MLPPGQSPFAGNLVVSREIELRGAFRFDDEFDESLELLAAEPAFDALVSTVVPVREAESAFVLAADRSRSCKVLLDLRRGLRLLSHSPGTSLAEGAPG